MKVITLVFPFESELTNEELNLHLTESLKMKKMKLV